MQKSIKPVNIAKRVTTRILQYSLKLLIGDGADGRFVEVVGDVLDDAFAISVGKFEMDGSYSMLHPKQ